MDKKNMFRNAKVGKKKLKSGRLGKKELQHYTLTLTIMGIII
jgi:hypothetical protein